MVTTVDNYKVKVSVEGGEGINNLKNDMEGLAQVGGPLGGTINGIISRLGPLGIAAGIAATAFATLGGRAAQLAGELSDIAGATGIAAGTLMNFRQSIVEAGGKAEDFAQIASRLNQSIQEAAAGNGKLQESFRALGVFVTDANGQIRPTEAILRDIIDRFRSGQMSAEQYAAAIDIMGKNINKLELAKLQAIADPIKDEQIRQIDKYNEAIDKLAETINNKLVTVFGKLAQNINDAIGKFAELQNKMLGREAELNRQGKTQGTRLETELSLGIASLFPREMTEEEKRRFRETGISPSGIKTGPAAYETPQARAENANEIQRLQNRTRPGGGFGNTPEDVIAAQKASQKRIADSLLEIQRQNQLRSNAERLSAILQFADEEAAIEERLQSQIKDIRINQEIETKKTRLDVFEQGKLTEAQKTKEFAEKEKEIRAKAELDIAKARAQAIEQTMSLQKRVEETRRQELEKTRKEEQRIQDIITQSKARVAQEEGINNLLKRKNEFLRENATQTDLEINRAQQLFDLEEARLKTLRDIALIKDIPPEERLKREQEINAIYEQRRQQTIDQQQFDRNLQQNFAAGYEKAYKQYLEDSRNYFQQAGRVFRTVTQGMEDSIVNFAKTGKLEFKSLISNVLETILRSQVQNLIAQIFSTGSTLQSSGNLFAKFLGIPGFANGGIIPTNGPVMVGERGPELLLGAAGRQVVPNNQLGGSQYVTYNINAVDASSFKSLVARDPAFIHAVAQQGARSLPTRR